MNKRTISSHRFALVTGRPAADVASSSAGGEPPDGADMEARITRLEAIAENFGLRFGVLGQDVAVMKSNYATRADVLDARNSVILWVVSSMLTWGSTVVVMAMYLAKHP